MSEPNESPRSTLASHEPPPRLPTGSWIRDHLLSIILTGLFMASLVGQLYFQYRHEVDQALQHGGAAPAIFSSDFWNSFLASVLENWQSEFLQLASFVVFATYFIHRGSPQSRDGSDEMAADIKAIKEKLGA
ncbi:MAG TPA: DUF6766 family protein [Acidimicrobiia bacterium]|nr:DUF6766 family protein [Acidimicrobiia bacterium]